MEPTSKTQPKPTIIISIRLSTKLHLIPGVQSIARNPTKRHRQIIRDRRRRPLRRSGDEPAVGEEAPGRSGSSLPLRSHPQARSQVERRHRHEHFRHLEGPAIVQGHVEVECHGAFVDSFLLCRQGGARRAGQMTQLSFFHFSTSKILSGVSYDNRAN